MWCYECIMYVGVIEVDENKVIENVFIIYVAWMNGVHSELCGVTSALCMLG